MGNIVTDLTVQEREFLLQILNASPIKGLDAMNLALIIAAKLQNKGETDGD